MEYSNFLDNIPDYDKFIQAEELDSRSKALARDHPSTVKLIDLGKTAGGREIYALRIGSGSHNALLYGFPNPEEPLGGLLIDYFSQALAEDEEALKQLNYTWFMIKCVDPDGASLTRGYIDGPYTPQNFALNFYRTPINLTGPMVFPYRYAGLANLDSPTPETIAIMKILDKHKIDFMSGLHTLRFGGVTFQVSEPCPELYSPFQMLARQSKVPLRSRVGTMLAGGVQLGKHLTPLGNYIRAQHSGREPLPKIVGARMIEYERLYNPSCFDLVPESSTWYDPRCYDESPSDVTLGEALDYESLRERATNDLILKTYHEIRSSFTKKRKFLEMLEDFVNGLTSGFYNVFDPPIDLGAHARNQIASVSQKIETEGRADIYYTPCYISMVIRAIDEQTTSGNGDSASRIAREKLVQNQMESHDIIAKKYDCHHYRIRNLIRMNLGSVLYSAAYAAKRNAPFELWH